MFATMKRAVMTKDIRNKILFTIGIIVLIRLGCQIPLPGVDHTVLESLFQNGAGGLDFFNALTGSSFANMAIFALNITVYITATIIMQLLTMAIPKLEELQKEGESGRQKIARITRYLTLGLAIAESVAIVIGFNNQGVFGSETGWKHIATLVCNVIILTAGAMIVTWLGEQITAHGLGNGISMVLLANILSTIPGDFIRLYEQFVKGADSVGMAVLSSVIILLVTIFVITFIVYLNDGERRIQIRYSGKMAGSNLFGGQVSHIPLKVNTAGVIPIIFAASLFQFPVIISGIANKGATQEWTKYFSSSYWCRPETPIYSIGLLAYIGLIIFFAYFYTQITFNPTEVANNLKRQSGVIPGIRPGLPTEEYLKQILKYLIFIGAAGLIIVAVIPMIVSGVFHASLSSAGTSMIIIVGVILETAKTLESMLMQRNYEGFLISS